MRGRGDLRAGGFLGTFLPEKSTRINLCTSFNQLIILLLCNRRVVLFLDKKNQKSRLYRFFNGAERRKTGNPINSLLAFVFHSVCFGYVAVGVAFGFG